MIQTLSVFYHHMDTKREIGRVAYKESVIYFEYNKEFLKTNLQLSPYKLPLRPGVFVCDDSVFEGLFGLFGDSLPDGWGRLLLDRYFMNRGISYSEITPLDRLSYIGAYGTGALSYEPIAVNTDIDTNNQFILDELAAASQEILKGESEALLDTLLTLGGSSAGARPKVMVQLSDDSKCIIHGAQALQKGYTHWLVKFASSHDSEDIAKVEYIYSLMAKDAGIEMSKTKLLHSKGNHYFATQRFDRVGDRRVHMHSVAGLTHSDFRVPIVDYDDLLALTLHLTKDVNQLHKMFRLAVFNLLTHNRDDHAKNFSYLMLSDGSWILSPAYDLTFSYGPGGEHSTTYLGEGKHPSKETLLTLANKHAISGAKEIIEAVEEVVANFEEYAKSVGLGKYTTRKISKVLQENI